MIRNDRDSITKMFLIEMSKISTQEGRKVAISNRWKLIETIVKINLYDQ